MPKRFGVGACGAHAVMDPEVHAFVLQAPGLQRAGRRGRLGAPGNGKRQLPACHPHAGLADGHRRRRTGGRVSRVGTAQTVFDADPGDRRVVHAHEDGEGLGAVRTLPAVSLSAALRRERAAHPGAGENAGAVTRDTVPGPQAETVRHTDLARFQVSVVIDARRGSNGRRQPGRERHLTPANAGSTRARMGHHLGCAVAQGRDHTDAADRDPPHVTRRTGSAADGRTGATAWLTISASM